MGKDEIYNYLRNAKIKNQQLEKISYYFSKDYTASQTAKELKLSRQTINNYYKIIRILLIDKQDKLINLMKDNCFCDKSFNIKYIKTSSSSSSFRYFIECNGKVLFITSNSEFSKNIMNFINNELQNSFINNQKTNSAKVLYNKDKNKFLLTKLLKSTNTLQEFVDTRLRKFRGLNQTNLDLQLKESQFRFNYSEKDIFNILLDLLKLNPKTSTI